MLKGCVRTIKNLYMNLKYESRDRKMKIKGRRKLDKSTYIVNNQPIHKHNVIKTLTDWARRAFVFQNGTVHLPYDTQVPVANVDEELVDLNVFDKTGMGALEYLITCVLAIGIKIGREMERRERENNEE